MTLIVQKFGGTSVKNPERIRDVANQVIKAKKQGHDILVVLSAMNDETDRLVKLAYDIHQTPDPRELDALVSTGEQVSTALLSMALIEKGYKAKSYTGFQAGILTDSSHKKARILDINSALLAQDLNDGIIPVVAGFQGMDAQGNITTLGRGGSDTSAVALASAMQAQECQIFTDVKGVYTADPRIVKDARCLSRVTFEEMLELSSLGAHVLQNRALEFASKYNIPLRVLSSFDESAGTLITYEDKRLEQPLISSIAADRKQAMFRITGISNVPGSVCDILLPINQANIEVDMLVQSVSLDHKTLDFSFTVSREVSDQVNALLNKPTKEITTDRTLAKLSVVGVGLRSHVGVPAKILDALSQADINIHSLSTSETKLSLLISEKALDTAIKTLHTTFGLKNL